MNMKKYFICALFTFIFATTNQITRYDINCKHNIIAHSSLQGYGLYSYNTYVICINIIRYYIQFKSGSELQIFENPKNSFLCAQSICQKFAERKQFRRHFFLNFVWLKISNLKFDMWPYFQRANSQPIRLRQPRKLLNLLQLSIHISR